MEYTWHFPADNDFPIRPNKSANKVDVLIRYKKIRWLKIFDVVTFNYTDNKFFDKDWNVTENIEAWSYIPWI